MLISTPYIRLNSQWSKRTRCLKFYLRDWISQEEFRQESLSKCFDNIHNNSKPEIVYNEILTSIPLTNGWDCYDFAKSIKLKSGQPREHIIFHAYWRADLRPIGDKQIATLKSFFATQDANFSSLILWTNGNISNTPSLKPLFEHFPNRFIIKNYDVVLESKGTPIEDSPNIKLNDTQAYLDGDLIRLLVLYKYGGMWFDMDSLLIRDFSPLMEHEWLGQWDCFMPRGYPFNGAFMRFRKNSPYLCELLFEIANGPVPTKSSIEWGGKLYYKIFRRLIQNGKKPFNMIPWCFVDPQLCHPYNSMPSAFDESDFDKERLLQSVWADDQHSKSSEILTLRSVTALLLIGDLLAKDAKLQHNSSQQPHEDNIQKSLAS
ncbi:7055_t:CDS:2, partial [Gigaspora rosea]